MDPTHATTHPPPSSNPTLATVASTDRATNPMPNTTLSYASVRPQYNAILSTPYTETSGKPRIPLLPPQWPSTEQILSGVFARNDGRMDPRKDLPKGWFPYLNPNIVMPTSLQAQILPRPHSNHLILAKPI